MLGGFSPAELRAKHGLEVADPVADHTRVAEADLGRLAQEVYAHKGDKVLSVEAYHPYSIGFSSDICVSGVYTKKVMPPGLRGTFVRRHASVVSAHRSKDTWVYSLDVKTKSVADIIDIVNVVRVAGCYRIIAHSYADFAKLSRTEWAALREFLRQCIEPPGQ